MSFKIDNEFSTNEIVTKVLNEVIRETENKLLEQLNDFISRDLITVEKGPLTIVQDQLTSNLLIQQSVQLVLKDKEYILKLEKENKELNAKMDAIQRTWLNTYES